MTYWLPAVLMRVRRCAVQGQVRFTFKALEELALLDMGLDVDDVCDVLSRVRTRNSAGRIASESTGEWLYVFKIPVFGIAIYIKLLLRNDCLVVSFHEDTGGTDDRNFQ